MISVLMAKLAEGQKLSAVELLEMQEWFKKMDSSEKYLSSIRTETGLRVGSLEANIVASRIPVSREIQYRIQSAQNLNAGVTYQPVNWDGTYFGSIGDALSSACVVKVPGYNSRFQLAKDVPDHTPIRISGFISYSYDVAPDAAGVGVFVATYPQDGSGGGAGQSLDWPTGTVAYPTIEWNIVDTLSGGDFWQIEVSNYTASNLAVSAAEINFSLA